MFYDQPTLEKLYRGPSKDIPWDLGRPYRQLIEFVRKNKPCLVLDVGCGTGTDAIFLAQKGFGVTGIDISKEAIKKAKKKAKKAKVKVNFVVGDVYKMPFEDETFEFINDNGCFHQLDKRRRATFIKEVHRVMKPGGKYLMKCFSVKEPPDPRIPHQLSKEEIEKHFSDIFKVQYIKPAEIEGKHGNHQGYSCLMVKKQKK